MELFIILKQENMSVAEYSIQSSTFSRYDHSLVSNQKYGMSHFVTGVADLVVEECFTDMLHDYMTLARLVVYVP